MELVKIPSLHAAVSYIALKNKNVQNQIGYCGTDSNETLQTIEQEWTDLNLCDAFVMAEPDGEVRGVCGIDVDVAHKVAEVGDLLQKSAQRWISCGRFF